MQADFILKRLFDSGRYKERSLRTAAQPSTNWDRIAILNFFLPTQTLTLFFFEYRHVVSAQVLLVPVVVVALSLSGICACGASNRVLFRNDLQWELTAESGVRVATFDPKTPQVGAWD